MGARHAVQGIGRPERRSFGDSTNASESPDAVAVARWWPPNREALRSGSRCHPVALANGRRTARVGPKRPLVNPLGPTETWRTLRAPPFCIARMAGGTANTGLGRPAIAPQIMAAELPGPG